MYVYSIIFIDCAGIKQHGIVRAESFISAVICTADPDDDQYIDGELTEMLLLPIEVMPDYV